MTATRDYAIRRLGADILTIDGDRPRPRTHTLIRDPKERAMHRDRSKDTNYRPEPCQPCAPMFGEDAAHADLEYPAPDPTPEQLAADGQAVLDRIRSIAAN
ncbi:hypothetical protein FHR83_006802 [Actinoplanes campanulatus]|uniref:Uncharacterized protein n=1 Tax=Actinoplanes campanulatus TaxID=113559 RepID=A0A7W5AN03_9ACTN|nr:hypothetical protein [Actinoplanes campanulatus]MBB3099096.1 hypothetical protein [Actinoplanes campanulatus]GGN39074.1 hypothetical protein GCM10010109_66570 [Actinoplanes campanulatus]GID40252.1 hypothetical protein Aca09nite_67580 [Actinoplanes campanulatus]